jgi:hypothetical protein
MGLDDAFGQRPKDFSENKDRPSCVLFKVGSRIRLSFCYANLLFDLTNDHLMIWRFN